MKIGEKILVAIRRKGITQKKLADYLGVSSPSVARWITNESYPMVDKFIKMVEYLELVEDFFPGYKKINPQEEKENATLKERLEVVERKMERQGKAIDKLIDLVCKDSSAEDIVGKFWDE